MPFQTPGEQMNVLDDELRKVLTEFAEFCVKNEAIPENATRRIVFQRLVKEKWNEIVDTATKAGVKTTDLETQVRALIAKYRGSETSQSGEAEAAQRRDEMKQFQPYWKVEQGSLLDWKVLAVQDENFLGLALAEHGCGPEVIKEIVSSIEPQTTPLRKKLEESVGAAMLDAQFKLFAVFAALNFKFEVSSDHATGHDITVPLYYLSCENIEGSRISFERGSELKDRVDLSLRVFGIGLSGHVSYGLKCVSEFAAEPGQNWVEKFEVKVELLPARLLWGNYCISERTYISKLGEGTVRPEPLDQIEWNETLKTLATDTSWPSQDLTQVGSSMLKTITETSSVEIETTFSAKFDPKVAGLTFGPKVVRTRGRKITVKYILPGSHRYTLFFDKERQAAWYTTSGNF